jgi:SAM-dependent methyltransferase
MIPTALTNRIRTVLDHYVPRRIRDSRWFMYPMFWIWFKGKHVRTAMEFKDLAPRMTSAEFREIYRTVENMGSSRETDTNPEALAFAMDAIDRSAESLVDVGCGRGYVLRALQRDRRFDAMALTGCDVLDRSDVGRARYVAGDIDALPFADASIDVVLCFHTLEHTRDLPKSIAELRRIAKRQLIIIVPRQERLHYTLDLHLQFFPTPQALADAVGAKEVRQFGSDLVAVL